jgi:hypothetical protein
VYLLGFLGDGVDTEVDIEESGAKAPVIYSLLLLSVDVGDEGSVVVSDEDVCAFGDHVGVELGPEHL